ncbi:MAG TPA: hypothetical protein VI248_00435 [Kineosporiaceae bacterium]
MKRRLGIVAVVLAAVTTVAACGGGGTQTATTGQNNQMAPAAPTSGGAAAAGQPAGGADAMASGDAGANGNDAMAGGDMKAGDGDMKAGDGDMKGKDAMGGGNEMMTDEEKLPMGMTGAKAAAAGMGTDGNPVISVVATETTCKANKAAVPAGMVWFKLTNKGMKFNELYLEDAKGKELIQAANVKAGQVGAFKWNVKQGKMQLACELEDKGKQIRVPLKVTAPMM